jgi:hypothetical protein
VNVRGEQFNVGDEVAMLPDCAHAPKQHGVVRQVLYAGFHVNVEWKDYALLDAHIDRITHRP